MDHITFNFSFKLTLCSATLYFFFILSLMLVNFRDCLSLQYCKEFEGNVIVLYCEENFFRKMACSQTLDFVVKRGMTKDKRQNDHIKIYFKCCFFSRHCNFWWTYMQNLVLFLKTYVSWCVYTLYLPENRFYIHKVIAVTEWHCFIIVKP